MEIDYSTPVGQVRLNIADVHDDVTKRLLTDPQISALLQGNRDSVNRASWRALIIIASSEVLVSKKIRTQDVQTDGPATSAELRLLAATYLAAAQEEEAKADEDADEGFMFVSFGGSRKPEATGWPR